MSKPTTTTTTTSTTTTPVFLARFAAVKA